MASPEGDQPLARAFHAIMNKIEADTSNCKEVELELNLHTSRILFQKKSSYKCQFSTKVHAPSRPVSEVWKNVKMFQPKY